MLLMLKVLFTQDSEFEDMFCDASTGSEPSLFFINNIFSLGFEPVQGDIQYDCTRNSGRVVGCPFWGG